MYGPASTSSNNPNGGNNTSDGGGRPRQFTPKGQMAGAENAKSAIQDLPLHMVPMFEARPMPKFFPKDNKKTYPPYSGVAQYLRSFELLEPPPPVPFVSPAERKRKAEENIATLHKEQLELLASSWDPHNNSKATSDAFCTLFVSRLSYDTTEKKLRREFEQFGPIVSLRLVTDQSGKSQGYAFIQFEKEEDMKIAYKEVDNKKIDGRRVVVDVERGRTVRNWRPMRLGGGLGGRKPKKSKKAIEYEAARLAAANSASAATSSVGAYGRRDDPPQSSRDRPSDSRRDTSDRYAAPSQPTRGRSRSRDRGAPSTRPRDNSRNRGSRNDRPRDDSRDRGRERDRDGDRRDRGRVESSYYGRR